MFKFKPDFAYWPPSLSQFSQFEYGTLVTRMVAFSKVHVFMSDQILYWILSVRRRILANYGTYGFGISSMGFQIEQNYAQIWRSWKKIDFFKLSKWKTSIKWLQSKMLIKRRKFPLFSLLPMTKIWQNLTWQTSNQEGRFYRIFVVFLENLNCTKYAQQTCSCKKK